MVTLTRLGGSVFALNPDLIERIDCTPDTVITLVDGTKYIVQEPISDVIAAVVQYRASVVSAAGSLERGSGVPRPRLVPVPASDDTASVVAFPQQEG